MFCSCPYLCLESTRHGSGGLQLGYLHRVFNGLCTEAAHQVSRLEVDVPSVRFPGYSPVSSHVPNRKGADKEIPVAVARAGETMPCVCVCV